MSRILSSAVALTAFLAGVAHAATASLSTGPSCEYQSITMDAPSFDIIVTCKGPAPTPKPLPTPPPVPPPAPAPGNVIQHNLLTEGSNNYVFDGNKGDPGPQGTIQALRLPMTTADGRVVSAATYDFTDYIVYTPSTLSVEIAFSRTPGDFTYYKTVPYRFTPDGVAYYPCGMIAGPVATINRSPDLSYDSCAIPATEQWYLNWRIVGGCDAGRVYNCGQVLIWHYLY